VKNCSKAQFQVFTGHSNKPISKFRDTESFLPQARAFDLIAAADFAARPLDLNTPTKVARSSSFHEWF
jgi:hypothetical protein